MCMRSRVTFLHTFSTLLAEQLGEWSDFPTGQINISFFFFLLSIYLILIRYLFIYLYIKTYITDPILYCFLFPANIVWFNYLKRMIKRKKDLNTMWLITICYLSYTVLSLFLFNFFLDEKNKVEYCNSNYYLNSGPPILRI